jgi:hypothetical protein
MSSAGITKPKMIAVGVVLVFVIVLALAFQRQQPKDLGRLVVLKQEAVGSNFKVRLQWQRPNKRLAIGGDLFGKDETGTLWKLPWASIMSSAGWTESKQEFTLIAPGNSPARWFVETEVFEPIDGISKLSLRAQMSLTSKSLSPLRGDIGPFYRTLGTVRSDYITNAVPTSPTLLPPVH